VTRHLTALLLVASLTLLSGCGGSDDEPGLSDSEQQAADNLSSEILRSGAVTGKGAVTEAQAGCIGRGTVTEVGVDRLQHYGILSDDLRVDKTIQNVRMAGDDAEALAGVFVGCLDAEKMFEDQFLDGPDAKQLTGAQRRCVADVIDEPTVREALALRFQGKGEQVYATLRARLETCAKPGGDQ
jgi:hypothetical protein